MSATPTHLLQRAMTGVFAALVGLAGLSGAGPARAGETAPTCIRPGQCFVTTNRWTAFAGTTSHYTATAGGQLFGIARGRVSACRMVSSAHRNGKRVRYSDIDCLQDLREGNPFRILAFNNPVVQASCDHPTTMRSRLTLVIDGNRHSGAVAVAVARPCSDV